MTDASLLVAAALALAIAILAEPGIRLIGGEEYVDAAPVLRIQALALVPLFLVQTWQLGLIAGRAQRAMALANGLALVLVLGLGLVFVPDGGAKAAAWVAVAAETGLAIFLWVGLTRSRPGVAPSLRPVWKVTVAAAPAAAAGYALRDRPVLATAVAMLLFAVAAVVLRAVPPDAYHALGLSREREDE